MLRCFEQAITRCRGATEGRTERQRAVTAVCFQCAKVRCCAVICCMTLSGSAGVPWSTDDDVEVPSSVDNITLAKPSQRQLIAKTLKQTLQSQISNGTQSEI